MATCSLMIEIVTDRTIESLTRRAFVAMDRAGLDDAFDHLADVLAFGRGKFLEGHCKGDQIRIALKPFAELALRDAIDISADRCLDDATKNRRLLEMFALAGLE